MTTMGQGGSGAPGDWSSFCATLLAMAAHDLRQPLQVLVGMHSWLDHRLTGDSEREYLRRGGLAIARLTDQIDYLTDALRLYGRSSSVALVCVPLAPIFAELLRDNIDAARSGGIELRLCRTSIAVMSDPALLPAALRNVVQNALKYTPPGNRVLVGCRRRGDEVSIEVHDGGIGIPAAQLSRLFEAFHRLDATRSRGLGLGLYIVKEIADLLGHRIDVRSEIGRGSCFALWARASVAADLRAGAAS